MFEIKLKQGEGKRILGLVHPSSKKITWLTMEPGVSATVPDELGKLVKDKRFIAKHIETKSEKKVEKTKPTNPKIGEDKK